MQELDALGTLRWFGISGYLGLQDEMFTYRSQCKVVELYIDDASATQSCSRKLLHQAEGELTKVARRHRQDGGSKQLKTGQCNEIECPHVGHEGAKTVQKEVCWYDRAIVAISLSFTSCALMLQILMCSFLEQLSLTTLF